MSIDKASKNPKGGMLARWRSSKVTKEEALSGDETNDSHGSIIETNAEPVYPPVPFLSMFRSVRCRVSYSF